MKGFGGGYQHNEFIYEIGKKENMKGIGEVVEKRDMVKRDLVVVEDLSDLVFCVLGVRDM